MKQDDEKSEETQIPPLNRGGLKLLHAFRLRMPTALQFTKCADCILPGLAQGRTHPCHDLSNKVEVLLQGGRGLEQQRQTGGLPSGCEVIVTNGGKEVR